MPTQTPIIALNESTHVYTHADGHQPPGVTSILQANIPWSLRFAHVDPADLERKGDLGRAVHLACEYLDQGVLDWDSLDPAVRPYVDGWGLFLQEKRVEIVAIEQRLYHPVYGYAGTLDRVLRADTPHGRGLVMGDIKTGDSTMAGAQTAAYLQAWREMHADQDAPTERWTIQLHPTGRYTLDRHTSRDDWYNFLAALRLFTLSQSTR